MHAISINDKLHKYFLN